MRKRVWGLMSCLVFIGFSAHAELQNVQIGGKLEVYGAWYSGFYESPNAEIRVPLFFLPKRPIGPNGTISFIRAREDAHNLAFFEQRTRLNASADFTDQVSAFVELDSIDTWGEDFRSNYLTGADARANTGDDVEVFQSYITAEEMWGYPVSLRVGRQALDFGSGWLVGSDPGADPFTGLSFDAVRLTYAQEAFTADVWWSKLAENSPLEQDGDVDFYGVYLSYTESGDAVVSEPLHTRDLVFPFHNIYHSLWGRGILRGETVGENDSVTYDMYWLYVRDGGSLNDTNRIAPGEWLENVIGLDDYDVTNLYTVGARCAGQMGAWNWEVEAAYQWGNADALGSLFIPTGGVYGDDGAKWSTWAGHAELGYTFDCTYSPRVYLCGSYYGGEDKRDLSFWDWINPFYRSEASVSFNRLFSSWREEAAFDASNLSNFWKACAGVGLSVSESVELDFSLVYLQQVEAFDSPSFVKIGRYRVPIAPALAFLTKEEDKDLGWQANIVATYAYSDDLSFELGYTHYFTGDAIAGGAAFIDEYGTLNVGGLDNEDLDYVYFMSTLEF